MSLFSIRGGCHGARRALGIVATGAKQRFSSWLLVKMEAYANDACRTVAAQVAEAVGFQGMTQSTADTLAEVLAR